MKKITIAFLLIIMIGLTSCDTFTKYTVNVSVDRHPTLTILNQTGHPVVITTPVSSSINNEARIYYQPSETNRSINVTYTISRISFTEQVTWNNADATVTLTKRPPTITVVNQTGRQVIINTPISITLSNGENHSFLAPVLNQNFNITYSSGLMQLIEQVTMRDQDVTVTLATGAPTLTIVNNIGSGNNINIIQFRSPGSVAWIGGNAIIRDNEFYLVDGTALQGNTTQVLANGEKWSLWLGNLRLSGNAFDIRFQTPSGTFFQKNNVRITRDMTLTLTASDRL